jgi:hypothetical protein
MHAVKCTSDSSKREPDGRLSSFLCYKEINRPQTNFLSDYSFLDSQIRPFADRR